jgi:hypothetical protein
MNVDGRVVQLVKNSQSSTNMGMALLGYLIDQDVQLRVRGKDSVIAADLLVERGMRRLKSDCVSSLG